MAFFQPPFASSPPATGYCGRYYSQQSGRQINPKLFLNTWEVKTLILYSSWDSKAISNLFSQIKTCPSLLIKLAI